MRRPTRRTARRSARLVLPTLLVLAACGGEAFWQTNEPDAVARWVRGLESPSQDAIWVCGAQWRAGGMAAVDADDRTECEALAARLARMMEAAGFGEAGPDDVPYPPLWEAVGGMRRNTPDHDAMDDYYRNRGRQGAE